MKTLIPIFIAVALLVLGCTEIEYIEIEKRIRDTVIQKEFVDRYFAGVDSTKIPTVVETPVPSREKEDSIIIQKDTIWSVRVDSVFIVETRTEYDTVVTREKTFGDTLFVTVGRAFYQVPAELQKMVDQFYLDAQSYGLNPPGYPMLIEYAEIDPILQAYSFVAYYQRFLKLNQTLTVDESYVPLMRELARLYNGKHYSADPNSVLHPFYPSDKIRWSNRGQYKEELKALFL